MTVELRDEHRQRIATVTATLTLALDRVHPVPPLRLVEEARQTHVEGARSLQVAETGDISQIGNLEIVPGQIDLFVQELD